MKITYLANFNNKNSDRTEQHIKYALEKQGHEVFQLQEGTKKADLKGINKRDLFLFHKGGAQLGNLIAVLCNVTCPKAFWYFDKINSQREEFIQTILPFVDYGFITDGTWQRRHKYKNLYTLRQGIGAEDKKEGKVKDKYKCDIAYIGQVYGEREQLVSTLKTIYGDKFKLFNNAFNEDLYDLCASAKMVVAPMSPSDELYWSSRFYMVLGSGGFLIHPDLYGLKEEFVEGKHFAGYKNMKELIMTIDYFLEHEKERKAIQKEGQRRCHKIATYEKRIKKLIDTINGTKTSK